ncbi:MAG: hypothetical protein Q7J54_04450, partial [Candidatus Woesearchaeota archaeon]|nr:hypothetical protein [Candidatus Woesearchaeota archaeon]
MRKTSNMKNKIKILFVAILMLASVFLISAGDIIFKAGNLDVSNNLAVNTDTLYVDSANKKVGIGTTSPRGRLQIGDLSSTLGLPTYPGDIILDKDPGGSNGIGGIEFRSSVSAGG